MMAKKKILIITFVPPYPPTDGGKTSIFGTVSYLRSYFDITLVFKTRGDKEQGDSETLKQLWPDVNIQNVHYQANIKKVEKHPPSFLKRVKSFFRRNLGIKKIKQIDAFTPYSFNQYDLYPFIPLDRTLLDFLEELLSYNSFDIIQVEHTPFLNLINILPNNSIKIFVQIENRYQLIKDYFNKNNDDSLYAKYAYKNAMFTEFELMNQYDFIFALSKNDRLELIPHFKEDKIFVAPFPVLNNLKSKNDKDSFEAKKIVFMGSQGHPPNEDAMIWFINSIYPSVNLKLFITGNWSEAFKAKYTKAVFTGFVEDLSELLHNSIVISPIRLGGGGIRAKVIEAMAMKCPLIATTLSCSGIEGIENNKNILIADNETEFINGIMNLQNNNSHCRYLLSNAFELISNTYSEETVGKIRKDIYNKITN